MLAFKKLLLQKPPLMRLSCYWSELEPAPKTYNFTLIKRLLTLAQEAGQPIVLTMGAKAIRYPEFFIPSFYHATWQEEVFTFLKVCYQELSRFRVIRYIQVENEPLDPSGPRQETIPLPLLQKEVAFIKKLWRKPMVLTLWGNAIFKRKVWLRLVPLADIVGIDLYYQIPVTSLNLPLGGPHLSALPIRFLSRSWGKPLWVSELQAEPWGEKGSMHPLWFAYNNLQASLTGAAHIFSWGCEWELAGRPKYWKGHAL